MKSLKLAFMIFGAIAGAVLLFWLVRRQEDDPIGEMVVDQDTIENYDDPGEDVDTI